MGRRAPLGVISIIVVAGALAASCAPSTEAAIVPPTTDSVPSPATTTSILPSSPADTTATTTAVAPASTTTATSIASEPAIAPTPTSGAVSATRSLRAAFTGDILAHSPLWRVAAATAAADEDSGDSYDFGPMFADIAPTLAAADLAVCHLETPIAPAFEPLSTYPLYGVPAEIASAISGAGYDRCSTASNHVLDRRVAGVDRTVDVLAAVGVAQSGMARFPEEIEPSVFIVNDIAVSHLSYTFGTNGIPVPSGEPWRTALIDPDRIIADATTARERGAEIVFVSLHWGLEGRSEPTTAQRSVAERLTASGAVDLIVGHHAHVLQPIEQINGVWVAFGLGNILSNLPVNTTWPASTQDGGIFEVSFVVEPDGSVAVARPTIRPTWVDKTDGWVVRDVFTVLADPEIGDGRRGQLERSLRRTQDILGEFLDD